jgi:hypothetical protein
MTLFPEIIQWQIEIHKDITVAQENLPNQEYSASEIW